MLLSHLNLSTAGSTFRSKRPGPGEPNPNAPYSTWTADVTANFGFASMAAAQIAMDHFNERNPSVVPQLADLGNCSVYFPAQAVADTQFNHLLSTEAVINTVQSQCTADKQVPCGVIGPALDRAAVHLQSITGALRIPQMLFYQMSGKLHGGATVIGVTVSTQQHVVAMLSYLRGREFLFVVYDTYPQQAELANRIQRTAQDFNLQATIATVRGKPGGDHLNAYRKVVRQIKLSGIKTIALYLQKTSTVAYVAALLEEEGMFTSEYIYILNGVSVPIDRFATMFAEIEIGSPLDKLLTGALVFDQMDNFRWRGDDPFLAAWRQQNSTFVDRMNSLMPVSPDKVSFSRAPADFFQTVDPVHHVSYVYDSVMALGFGGCMEQKSSQASPLRPQKNPYIDGILASEFDGASGHLSWKEGESVRDSGGLHFGLYNIRRRKHVDESIGKTPFEAALVSLWSKSTGWEDTEEENLLFRDGSTALPSTTREVLENNFLSAWVFGFGLALLGVAWALGFIGIFLLGYLRKDAIVQRAQPFFMQLLCGGSILTSTAIFTLSWDEGMGWSHHQLDIACMMTPWFFFVGHIVMLSVMFTKLWRIDKVMQFRRHNKVTVRNVLGPLVALLVTTLAILVTWTVLDPWTWERIVVSELPYETYGECGNDRLWAFVGPLMGLLVFAEGTSAFFAWKTVNVSDDFNDSSSIIFAVCTHMQAWAIGVPILAVLGNSSSDATYLGRVLLIWIFSVSSLACVVYPKLVRAIHLRRNPELRRKSQVVVSGLTFAASSRPFESQPTNTPITELSSEHKSSRPLESHPTNKPITELTENESSRLSESHHTNKPSTEVSENE
jgi:hypothetical protein